jgi:tetratricopeptide (TPR) repeat protein
MKRLLIFAAILAGLVACSKSPEEQRQELYENGLASIEQTDLVAADSAFARYQREYPDRADGPYGAGMVRESEFMYYDALLKYLEALQKDPSYVDAQVGVARMYSRLGEYTRAAEHLYNAFTESNQDDEVAVELISTLIDDRNFEAAERLLKQAEAAGLDPTFSDLLHARMLAYELQFDSSSVLISNIAAGQLQPPTVCRLLARYYRERGFADSVLYWNEQSQAQPEGTFIQRQDYFLSTLDFKDWHLSRSLIEPLEDNEDARMAYLGMQVLYYQARHLVMEAVFANKDYRATSDSLFSPIMYNIETLWRKSDLAGSESEIINIRSLITKLDYPEEFEDLVIERLLAFEAYRLDNYKSAIRIKISNSYKQGRRFARLLDLFVLSRVRAPEELKKSLDSMELTHGSDPRWLVGIGDVFSHRLIRQFDEAARYYQRALEIDPNYRRALRSWLAAYRRQLDFEAARSLLQDYGYLTGAIPEFSLESSLLAVRAGEIDEGTARFDGNIGHFRGDIDWYNRMAYMLLRQQRAQEADNYILKAVEGNPGNEVALLAAARWFGDRGNIDQLLEYTQQGLEIDPDNYFLLVQEARGWFNRGEIDKAVEQFEELRKRTPQQADVLMYYSHCLAAANQNPRLAGNMARAAILSSDAGLDQMLNLCYVYLRKGDYMAVRGEGGRTARTHPDSPMAFYYAGLGEFKVDKTAEARKYLQRAIDLGLWGEPLADARKMLAQQ